jgi:hypothetical protein
MSGQENVQIVKGGYAAFARGDIQGLLALFAEDIKWITPGEELPWARHASRARRSSGFLSRHAGMGAAIEVAAGVSA